MKITTKEYSEQTGLSIQMVVLRIKRGIELPGVVSAEKFGQTYVLEAKKNWKELAPWVGRRKYVRVTEADETAKF